MFSWATVKSRGRILARFGLAGGMAVALAGLTSWRAQAAERPVAETGSREPITDAVQIWALPSALKSVRHPLHLEGRVSYFDPSWKLFWLEQNHVGNYLQLAPNAPPMRAGQRVLIEGSLIPDKGLAADSATVRVLADDEPIAPLETKGRIGDLAALNSRVVTAEGYVDGQSYIDADHVRLALIVDDRPVIGWVKPDDPRAIPDWQGKFVRVQALYSGRFDPTNTATTIELWVGGQRHLTVLGSLSDNSQFNIPRTPIDGIYRLPLDTMIRVRGRVEGHEAGSFLVLRDNTGQVVVNSLQLQRLAFGTEVEAVGRVTRFGAKWVLRAALYRKAAPVGRAAAPPTGRLDTVDQIRQLSVEEAAQGRPVNISGMVTWSMPETDFFFLQDVSGGIRMRFDPKTMETPQLGKYLRVEGVTINGGRMPAVRVRQTTDLGSMSPPDAKPMTFEQAVAGQEDGQWVEMRGFVQRTDSEGDWRLIHLTTPGGEAVGHLQSPVNFVANPGSLIRVRGVCEATADAAGRLTGVMLRVPFLHSITIEEDAPVDYFDLPKRSIAGLRQLSGARDMTRVRVAGTVLHSIPGRTLYLQEGGTGLQLLTSDRQALAPGDRVEAVGILGWQGARIVLREAVFRRVGRGPTPAPVALADPALLRPELDSRLVTVRGTLIDASRQRYYTRLTLQNGKILFEATIESRDSPEAPDLPLRAGLELTGIYELGFDDTRQIRSFALQLRSPADIVVYRKPRVWTLQRALIGLGILGGCVLIGLAWIAALRRRVHQQTRQIREQLERQARLEAEIQRAARLESLGVLAGGIAHDFNNLLTIIMGNLGLAMLDRNLTDATVASLREIERGTARAAGLTRQLLTFAKGGDPIRSAVGLPEVVKSAMDLALRGARVRCEFTVAPGLWNVHVDRDQIAQAVQNLALNAVQAMPAGGTLRVALANDLIAAGATRALAPGRYVKMALADSGEGIPPEVLPKIFDPFFSTRKTGGGLGLATVYSIVNKHQGRIEVESTSGRGTTFHLWLPAVVAVDPPPAPASPPPLAAVAARMPRVLFMDDEESIRQVGNIVLRRAGLEPTVVADGATALREFVAAREAGRAFDLLILDLTIPGGMGGGEAIALIRKLDAGVPAIVASGYSSDPVMANFAGYGFQAMVSKPYEVGHLLAVVNRLLRRSDTLGA